MYNTKGFCLYEEPRICIKKYIYIIKNTNFSQHPIQFPPHHMPIMKNKGESHLEVQ